MLSNERMYEQMALIRQFEERLLELFSLGKLMGTTHTYVGQEATAVSLIGNLKEEDIIFSNHRCHGHFLARFEDPRGLLAEIMGREGGICNGRGGSQHLCRDNFYSNGIQGGYMPIAAGMAYAEKQQGSGGLVVAFIGDGTLGEGNVYEASNLASLWSVPLLILVENNRYAQTTPIELNLAGNIVDRFRSFGIDAGEIESNDAVKLNTHFRNIIEKVRSTCRPHAEVVHSYRLRAHSKGDDFRPPEEINQWWEKDPMLLMKKYLSADFCHRVDQKTQVLLTAIENEVENLPFATLV